MIVRLIKRIDTTKETVHHQYISNIAEIFLEVAVTDIYHARAFKFILAK